MGTTESQLMEMLKAEPAANQFVPYCFLSKEADALTVYFEGDPDYSERLTDHVTLFRSVANNELVGCRIKGITAILLDLPNYIHVDHDGVKLELVLLPFRGSADSDEQRKALNDLAESARGKNMTLQTC